MLNINIGLDIASNNTGISLFLNKELLAGGLIQSQYKGAFSGNKLLADSVYIQEEIIKFINVLTPFKGLDNVNITIASEMSHHGNKKVGQLLSLYVGIYTEQFINTLKWLLPTSNITVKLINPREWQLRAFGKALEREEGKTESIERAERILQNSKYYEDLKDLNLTDDVADAINIGSLASVIRDEYFIGQEVRQRQDQKVKNKMLIAKITTNLNNLYDKLRDKELKRVNKIINTKKYKKNKEKIAPMSLYDLADKNQKIRIGNYKAKLEELEQDTKIINKFYIMGKVD